MYCRLYREKVIAVLRVCMGAGLVPESACEVAEEGSHAEEPRSSSAQRPTADVQRSSHSTGRTVAPRARQTRPEGSPAAQRDKQVVGFFQ